jgi:outer membrane protein OmpA-like peptidoglycan-associated protein
MRCHPIRWLWGLIPIAMLSWVAVQVEHPAIQSDLERRSTAALAAAGHDWASVAFDGRDGLLVGHPRNGRQHQEAVALVRGIWGVRVVRTRGTASAIGDVPITPAAEPLPPEKTLDDRSPETVVSDLAPVAADQAEGVQQAPSETLYAAGDEHPTLAAHVSQALSASTFPTLATREVPAAVLIAPPAATAPLGAPPDAAASSAAAKPAAATVAVAVAEQAPEPPLLKAPAREKSDAQAISTVTAQMPIELPDRKPAPVPSTAPPPDQPAKTALAAKVELPEHKPPTPPESVSGATGPPAPARRTSEPKAPTPAAPRFETAALPPGNIAASGACLGDARAAALRVEVHFARGDARLDTPGKELIDGLIAALNACPDAVIRIAGHADATGKTRHNQVLSRHRARGVASYMTDKGIDARRLVAVGYGDKRPVAPNDTQANRARNRRIELNVTARAEPLPPMPIRKQGTRNGLSHR